MVDTPAFDVSNAAPIWPRWFCTLYTVGPTNPKQKQPIEPSKFTANLNRKARRLGTGFKGLASDVVNGLAFALLYTPQSDQRRMLPLLTTLRSIERFSNKRLSQNCLRRTWKRRSDARKIAGYRDVLRQQLAMFSLQDGISIRDNFTQVQMAQMQSQHPASSTADNRLGRGAAFSPTSGDGSVHAVADDHVPSSNPFPSQATRATESEFLGSSAQQQFNPHFPDMPGLPFSPPEPPSLLQTPFPTFLGSQVTIFVIDQLIAHFPSIIENHDSGNVTTTTVTGSANDSSIRSA